MPFSFLYSSMIDWLCLLSFKDVTVYIIQQDSRFWISDCPLDLPPPGDYCRLQLILKELGLALVGRFAQLCSGGRQVELKDQSSSILFPVWIPFLPVPADCEYYCYLQQGGGLMGDRSRCTRWSPWLLRLTCVSLPATNKQHVIYHF